ncbi:universal stress protein [Cytobacillus firmus]|jgi:nucleotide-binding universal stress UspA family protein|uniref:universal stress protein n=1 Tax=Cytobacillus firmus TaxID=1399 RepID=UPI0021620F40|nr:universal stress protein [Cytobacillus firmus]MCS0672742.1 universal stress protein [Cytobacillus firmus]
MFFEKIVVGYDDTDGSRQALNMAIELVKQHPEAQLLITQVFEETIENVPISNEKAIEPVRTNGYLLEGIQIPPLPVYHDESSATTHARVKHSVDNTFFNAREILEPYNINVKFDVIEGSPADSISEYAAAENADLIIVGSSGKGGIKKMFLGSTSSKIAKNAPCPVLIAKDKENPKIP